MTRVHESATEGISYRYAFNNNLYVYSHNLRALNMLCMLIEKSSDSIHWSKQHRVWFIRVRDVKTKDLIKNMSMFYIHGDLTLEIADDNR